MKGKIFLVAVLAGIIQLFGIGGVYAVDPVVSNVVAAQRGVTKLVDITYDLVDPDSSVLTVQIWVSSDGGTTWYIHADNSLGDIGEKVAPGTGKKITWDAGQDFAGFSSSNMKVKVVAIDAPSPPQSEYVYVDVSSGPSGAWELVELTAAPSDLLTNDVWKTTRILLRRIPAGSFVMGSPVGEVGRWAEETEHTVTISKPFFIGVFEVTQKQYENVMGVNPSIYKNNPKRPVEMVTWDVIRGGTWPAGKPGTGSFMDKLRQKLAGQMFDLPTESQWQYACRAGTIRAYNDQTKNGGEGSDCTNASTGEDVNLNSLAWYSFNSGSVTSDVGGKQANAWGLYDMHGNVGEWCLDRYGAYPSGPVTDPVGAVSGTSRVYCNGSLGGQAWLCRSARRNYNSPGFTYSDLGFRAAIAPQGQ